MYLNNEQRSPSDQSANDDDHADAEEGDEPVTFVEVSLGVGLVGRVHRQKNDDRRRHDEGAKPPEVPEMRPSLVVQLRVTSYWNVLRNSKKTDFLEDRSLSLPLQYSSKGAISLLKRS